MKHFIIYTEQLALSESMQCDIDGCKTFTCYSSGAHRSEAGVRKPTDQRPGSAINKSKRDCPNSYHKEAIQYTIILIKY